MSSLVGQFIRIHQGTERWSKELAIRYKKKVHAMLRDRKPARKQEEERRFFSGDCGAVFGLGTGMGAAGFVVC